MATIDQIRTIKSQWLAKLKHGLDHKRTHFQDFADEAMKFYTGPYDEIIWNMRNQSGYFAYAGPEEMPQPTIRMTVNRVAELDQLFTPALFHKNPHRKVNPRKMPFLPPETFGNPMDPAVQAHYLPMAQQMAQTQGIDKGRSILLESYLNYTPYALNLKTESRRAITETIIKGAGMLLPEVYRPVGAPFKFFGSTYKTIDHLNIDPDCEDLRDAKWTAIKYIEPKWQVAKKFNLPMDYLKGGLETYGRQMEVETEGGDGDYARKLGLTNDLITYWVVYSKMGVGALLQGVDWKSAADLDVYGDNVRLVICDTVEAPLNLPEWVLEDPQATYQALQWETPFWADDTWPFEMLSFHDVPRNVWPMSHIRPAMGELRFLNWAYSFIASKIRLECRDFIAIRESAGEEIKQAILSGKDYEVLKIRASHGEKIMDMVQFLQHPTMNGDIWKVISAIEANFEKRVGLTELIYGMSPHAYRSATEAQVKEAQLTIRPDDMANKVEDWMTEVARKEAFGARWHLEPQDLLPIIGQVGAMWWQQLVTPTDPTELLHSLEYRIEAGSIRKPNKDRDAQNLQQAMQILLPFYEQYAMGTGDVEALNNLISDWADSIGMDASRYMLKGPPLPPPAPPGKNGDGKETRVQSRESSVPVNGQQQ